MMLLNKRLCRAFLLDYAARTRSHKFNRVGQDAYVCLENSLRDSMRKLVDRQPGKGKTIKS